jgi:nitrous oxidase accessory protein NosD
MIALIGAMMVMPTAAFEPGECDIEVHPGDSIDAKVDSASDGQTVCVYAGHYGLFSINTPNITLKGEGADIVTLDCGGTYSAIGNEAPGCIVDGFKFVNSGKGIEVGLSATNCIVRNCVFEGLAGESGYGISLWAANTTFMNNVVTGSVAAYGVLYIENEKKIIVNNTIIDNPVPAMYIYHSPNSIFARNNFSNNSDIMVYDPGEGIKWYLNNFIGTSIGNPYSGPVPAVTYWNSTEEIEYVCPTDGTHMNYLGNYWSDYTTKYPGASEDGCGIWNTAYEVPDSLGNDYRPLMQPFENYPAPAAAKPDLNVTEKYETLEDGTFTVNYTVKNIGAGDAGESNTTIYVDGTPVKEDAVPALAAGENYTNTVGPFDCPCGTTVNVTVCADNGNAVDESDETNNCMENELVCTPCPKPDLNVTEKFETLLDGTFTVNYTVANVGGGDAGASNTTIYVDGIPVKKDAVPALAAGANYTNTVGPFDCPCGTTVNVTVCADNDDVVDESDETNNCMENELECTPCPTPDLKVTQKSETWVSEEDKTYTVTYTVKNIGGASAGASTTSIKMDGTEKATDAVPELAIGASHTATLGPFTMSGDSDTIRVCADKDNAVSESDETNNCMENVFEAPTSTTTIDSATGTGSVTLETTGGHFENVEAEAVESLPEEPPHVMFPHGLFSFRIGGLSPGQSVTVRIVLPSDMPTDTEYWKFGPTLGNPTPHWYQLIPLGDNDGDNVLEITLIDGGLGDDDLTADGVIIDQGGPCNPPVPVPEFSAIGLIGLIGVLSVVLAVTTMGRRKRRE